MSIGLMVLRGQPLHDGHVETLFRMSKRHETVLAGLGSTGHPQDPKNPWTQSDRITMVRNVFGSRVNFVYLEDIGAEQGRNDWCDYVIKKCIDSGFDAPTDYYSGSEADATWYKERFPEDKLHIADRFTTGIPSATDIRLMLAMGDDGWKRWVPEVNHAFIERTFPERFKLK